MPEATGEVGTESTHMQIQGNDSTTRKIQKHGTTSIQTQQKPPPPPHMLEMRRVNGSVAQGLGEYSTLPDEQERSIRVSCTQPQQLGCSIRVCRALSSFARMLVSGLLF